MYMCQAPGDVGLSAKPDGKSNGDQVSVRALPWQFTLSVVPKVGLAGWCDKLHYFSQRFHWLSCNQHPSFLHCQSCYGRPKQYGHYPIGSSSSALLSACVNLASSAKHAARGGMHPGFLRAPGSSAWNLGWVWSIRALYDDSVEDFASSPVLWTCAAPSPNGRLLRECSALWCEREWVAWYISVL